MIPDLRTLIKVFETENQIIRIQEEVDLDYQITAFLPPGF